MLDDFIVCPECHKRLEPELVRCKYCHAYVHDTSPWRKDNILLVVALTVTALLVIVVSDIVLGKVAAGTPQLMLWLTRMRDIFGDGISRTILALGIYGVILLWFKNRITNRQQRTFRVVREYCAEHNLQSPTILQDIRTQIHKRGFGSYNTLLAYTRLQWLVETSQAPQEEREARIDAMREHGQTDWEALESAFASAQFLVWLLPSLGFLGTVWGMTQALGSFGEAVGGGAGNLSFQSSLTDTAKNLGIAFHTTLVGLAMVIPVLLMATTCRRRTQMFLERLDKFFIRMSTQLFTENQESQCGTVEPPVPQAEPVREEPQMESPGPAVTTYAKRVESEVTESVDGGEAAVPPGVKKRLATPQRDEEAGQMWGEGDNTELGPETEAPAAAAPTAPESTALDGGQER